VKAEVAVTPNRVCVYVGEPRAGRLNDKRIFDEGGLPDLLKYDTIVQSGNRRVPKELRHAALFDGGYPGIGIRGYYKEGMCRLNRPDMTDGLEADRQVVERFYGAVKMQCKLFCKTPIRLSLKYVPDLWLYACSVTNARLFVRHPEMLEPPENFHREVPIPVQLTPAQQGAKTLAKPAKTHPDAAWSVVTCANLHHLALNPPPQWNEELGVHDVTPLPDEPVDQETEHQVQLRIAEADAVEEVRRTRRTRDEAPPHVRAQPRWGDLRHLRSQGEAGEENY
jgi:hypothetical protein